MINPVVSVETKNYGSFLSKVWIYKTIVHPWVVTVKPHILKNIDHHTTTVPIKCPLNANFIGFENKSQNFFLIFVNVHTYYPRNQKIWRPIKFIIDSKLTIRGPYAVKSLKLEFYLPDKSSHHETPRENLPQTRKLANWENYNLQENLLYSEKLNT